MNVNGGGTGLAQFRHSYKAIFLFCSRSCLHLVVIKINNLVGGVIRTGQPTTYDMYCIHRTLAQIWLYIGGIRLPIGTVVTPQCSGSRPGSLSLIPFF